MSLIFSLSLMLKDLFYKSLFIIKYILENKVIAIILGDICNTKYNCIIEEFTEIIC